jgi:hypothetical protein
MLQYIPGYLTPASQSKQLNVYVTAFVMCHNGDTMRDPFTNQVLDFNRIKYWFDTFYNLRLAILSAPAIPNPAQTLEQSDAGIRLILKEVVYAEAPVPYFPNKITADAWIDASVAQKWPDLSSKTAKSTVLVIGRAKLNGGYADSTGQIRAATTWLNDESNGWNSWNAFMGEKTVVHEFGHVFGLRHTHPTPFPGQTAFYGNNDGLDDTPPDKQYCIPALPSGSCQVIPDPQCPNLLMGYRHDCEANWNYLSPKQIAVMRRNIENDKNYGALGTNGYFGSAGYSGLTATLVNCQKNPQQSPYVVNTNEVWEKAVVLDQDLIVKTGATLTIRCRLNMPQQGKITVEPGAKLVVDEGTITNACGYVWQGIELWGNSAVAQTLSGGYYPQAHLVLKNDAVIENARNAVTTWKFNDYTKTGGIITASDAIFRNNHRSVEFISYPFAEKSTFKNCTFIIDGPLNDGGYCTNMVTAWNVNGTSFQGCTFDCTYTGLYGTAPLPKGIYTHNANFRVIPLCTAPPGAPFPCPPTQQQPNYFKGLFYGIHATNGTSFPYRVDSAHFENCAYGIYSDRVNNFQVTRSTFKINPFYATGTATGIENNCGTGFKIEGNRFYSTHTQAQNYLLMGLMNVNTGPALNEVYRNKYENLRIANNSALTNWSWGGGNTDQGLKYKCNTHTGNRRDLMVVNGTVGQNQGEVTSNGLGGFNFSPAGNTFSVTTDPVGHIANFGQNLIRYVHHNPASTPLIVQPTNITLNNVTLQFSNLAFNSGSCPSKLGKQISDSKTEFFSAKSNYDDVRYVYDNLLNGGNTQTTLQQVENSWPAQAWELRNQLLAKSPFLDMEVLYGVAERTDVLPHALMLEVFMANPHCAKDRRFLAYLENKPVPMPGWMINLLAGNTARTLKDDLEAAMSQQASVWATAADEIIHHYLSDEAGYSPDSALAWVNRKTTYVAKLQKSDLSASNTAYGDALADIQLIRDSFVKLPDELSADLNSREDLYTLLAGFGQDYWALDTAAQLTLLNFALSGKMAGHTEAANILRFFYGYAIDHTLFAEEPEPKSIKNSTAGNTHHDALLMKVYPNPGDEFVVFEYILPELPLLGNEFWAEILDLEGRVLFSESLNGTRGVKTVDVSGFKAGAYLYRLSGKTGTLESGTLIIK